MHIGHASGRQEIHAAASAIAIVTINFRMRQFFWPLEVVRTQGLCRPLPFGPHIVGLKSRALRAGFSEQDHLPAWPVNCSRHDIPAERDTFTARSRPAGGQIIETRTAAPPHVAASCLVLRLAAYRGLHHDDNGAAIPDRTKPGLEQLGWVGGESAWQFLWPCPVSNVSDNDAKLWALYATPPEPQPGSSFSLILAQRRRPRTHSHRRAPSSPEPVDDTCGGWWRLNNLWCHGQ